MSDWANDWHALYQEAFTQYHEATERLAKVLEESANGNPDVADEAKNVASDIREKALAVSSDCENLLRKAVKPARCVYHDGFLTYDGNQASAGLMHVARCSVCRDTLLAIPWKSRPAMSGVLAALGHAVNSDGVTCLACCRRNEWHGRKNNDQDAV